MTSHQPQNKLSHSCTIAQTWINASLSVCLLLSHLLPFNLLCLSIFCFTLLHAISPFGFQTQAYTNIQSVQASMLLTQVNETDGRVGSMVGERGALAAVRLAAMGAYVPGWRLPRLCPLTSVLHSAVERDTCDKRGVLMQSKSCFIKGKIEKEKK